MQQMGFSFVSNDSGVFKTLWTQLTIIVVENNSHFKKHTRAEIQNKVTCKL